MSIRKMIALHPKRPEQPGAGRCGASPDVCVEDEPVAAPTPAWPRAMDMTQCIRLCLDASDICEATARLGARRTGDDQPMLRELLELCARMCEQCAAECEQPRP